MIKHLCTRSFMLMILLSFGWEMIAQEQPPDEPDDAEAVVPVFDLTGADLAEPPEPIDIPAAIPPLGLTQTAPAGLQVVLHEAFLAGGTTDWMQGTDWQIGFTQVGHAAQTHSNTPVLLIPTPLDNVAIETRFELGFGRMQLHLRQSDWGRYTAEYDAGGELRLYRNELLLGQVAAPATTEWSAHSLRFTALGDQLGLSVDGVQMLQLVDPDPLPAGTVVIGGVFPGDDDRSVLRFDTLTVWAEAGVSVTSLTLSEPEALTQMPGLTGRLDNHIVSAVWLGARREEIYVRTLRTPNTHLGQLLVGRRGSLEGYPRLSPGGDKLAFISSIGGDNNSYTNLYVVDLTAENLRRLPIPTGKWRAIAPITTRGHSTGGPAWSPDGNQIAFHSNRAGQGWKIWVVNADGTGLRRLTAHGNLISEHDPSWSPDGTQIVFAATGCGSRSDLYVTSVRTPQGGACGVLNQQRIVSGSGDDTRPRWSPDGRFIAYTAYRGGQPDVHIQALGRRYIYQVGRRNYGPSGNLNLTINAPGGSRNLDPAWSPDGSRLVFASTADANTRLHVLTLQVQGQRIRLQNPGWVRDPISPAVSAPYGGADWSLPAARAIAPPAINNVIEVHEALEEDDARLGIGVEPGPTDGTCTLNEAILAANSLASSTPPALPQGQTDCRPRESNGQLGIYLALISGNTYVVSEALPAITGRVTIQKAKQDQGTSVVQIARSANAGTGQFRVFTVAAGGHLTLDRVRVSHGDVDGDGGGIHNAGTLILQNGSVVTGNSASGNGGGIYNSGTLQMSGGCLVGNTAPTSSAVHSTVRVTISGVWWGRASGPGDGAVNDRVTATNPLQTAPTGCGTTPDPPTSGCTATINLSGGARHLNVRSSPDTSGQTNVVGRLLQGDSVTIRGRYNTWYLIDAQVVDATTGQRVARQGVWIGLPGAVVLSSACGTIPIVDASGNPLPPTPVYVPPRTHFCAAFSTEFGSYTNIRDFPQVPRGTVIGRLSDDGNTANFAAYHVRVVGRYTANTPNILRDDWYKVTYNGLPAGVSFGWVSAEYATLRPGFDHANCRNIEQIGSDAVGNLIPATTPAVLPPLSGMIPEASALYGQLRTDAKLRYLVPAAVSLNLPGPFQQMPMYEGVLTEGQGYGLNTFAYRNPHYYEGTNHIHSGLDFGGLEVKPSNSPIQDCTRTVENKTGCFRVLQICDGVVSDVRDVGTGYRVVVRCFSREGSRSNVYLSYNHLLSGGSLQEGQYVTAGGDYGLHVYQYSGNNYPHLHLELLYDRDGNLGNAIRLNPIFFFSSSIVDPYEDEIGPYYPESDVFESDRKVKRRRFEWTPADRVDPVNAYLPQDHTIAYDGVNWHNNSIDNRGLTEDEGLRRGNPDFDLGIQLEENNAYTLIGDRQDAASNLCRFTFGRTDRPVIFRYGAGSCTTNGLQLVPDGNGYNGFEIFADSWITSMDTFMTVAQDHDDD